MTLATKDLADRQHLHVFAVDPIAFEGPATGGVEPDTATFAVVRSGSTDDALHVRYVLAGSATPGDPSNPAEWRQAARLSHENGSLCASLSTRENPSPSVLGYQSSS